MTLEQLETLMLAGDMTRCMNVFEQHLIIRNVYEAIRQYYPQLHGVKDEKIRKDKYIRNSNGDVTDTVKVSRLALPIQKRIVLMASAFLGIPEMESSPQGDKEEAMQSVLDKIWDANKLDYKFRTIAKKTMSERHSAELWYLTDVDQAYWDGEDIDSKKQLSMRILANSLGDTMYPVFDEYGNMIAFGRGYRVAMVVDGKDEPEYVQHFDVYTEKEVFMSRADGNAWLFGVFMPATADSKSSVNYTSKELVSIPNIIGKIPVIYYSQPILEWEDVQDLIERLEKKISNHADTNDYFDSPIIIASGNVESFAEKGEAGKLLQMNQGADVKYLTWDQAPESTKMEIENLQKFIYSFTNTPDISFENMKGLGIFSGIAIKMLFLDAQLKAIDKEEIFGEGVQRRINFLKKAISVMDESFVAALPMEIKPKFSSVLPQNITETIDTLATAVSAGIMTNDTAVRNNPLVTNPQDEIDALAKEGPEVDKPVLTKVI